MRKHMWEVVIAAFVIVLGLTAVVPKAFADNHEQNSCNVELLEGTFGYAAQALTLFPPPSVPPSAPTPISGYAPFAFAGTISFDGHGNLHGADVVNLGFGGIPRTYTGTYSVVDSTAKRRDCAFVSTFSDSLGNTVHTYMVLVRDGQALKLVNTDPGFVLVLEAEKK